MHSLEQHDAHDDLARDDRDTRLVRVIEAIHNERNRDPAKVAVVFGAAHIPAVVDYLTGKLRYQVEDAVWITVAHAPET